MTIEDRLNTTNLLFEYAERLYKQLETLNADHKAELSKAYADRDSERVKNAQILSKLDEVLLILREKDALVTSQAKKIATLEEQLRLSKKNLFGSKSQKGSGKKIESKSREQERDDFDGTPGSLGSGQDEPTDIQSDPQVNVSKKEISRPYRLGLTYRRMEADRKEWHDSDNKYRLLPAMKSLALEKGSIVNCDETWCRVCVSGSYKKKYIWCMVNKQSKIAIFFYDDGSRGRDVLKGFLGNAELDALQSDGYNVYLYFEQIREGRQGVATIDIMVKMRCKLDELLQQEHVPRSDLMHKALTYLDKLWIQLFAYRDDGRYDIDNSIAERAVRPLTIERKNSLAFGGHRGVETSAIYHTIIETCKMNGISVLEYFKKFFREILAGRQDYENLLPMTIGIK